MKRIFILLVLMSLFMAGGFVVAQSPTRSLSRVVVEDEVATTEAEATPAAEIIEESRPKDDLTEPAEAKSRLERVLDSKEVDRLTWNNFLQVAIRRAVSNGVPVNTLVLMMLFPLVAALIAAARHVVGLQGFGIFTPAVISVAFLATGVTVGVLLFLGIILVGTLGRMVIRKLGMPSLPRMALLIWFVSMGVLGLVLASPWLRLQSLVTLSIFPVLLLVLLAETFIEVQITTTLKNAIKMTFQTLLLALVAFLVMSMQVLQEWVLLNPEVAVLGIVVLDVLIGRFDGLRWMERVRFRKLLQK